MAPPNMFATPAVTEGIFLPVQLSTIYFLTVFTFVGKVDISSHGVILGELYFRACDIDLSQLQRNCLNLPLLCLKLLRPP